MKPKTRLRVVPASQAKNNFGQIIKRVYEKGETQIIERAGLPVAAIVPMDDLERLYPQRVKEAPRVAMGAKRHQAAQRLRALLDEAGSEEFSEEEVEADVMREWQDVRHGKH